MVLARRYALALFELAAEDQVVDRIGAELDSLGEAVSTKPLWVDILDDVIIPLATKQKMISEVGEKAKLHRYTLGVLGILAEKRRGYLWNDIVTGYKEEVLKSREAVEARVTVADKKVWKALQEEVGLTVKEITGKEPRLKLRIDPSIIGGLVIRIGDTVYDGSVRGEIKRFEESLMEGAGEIF